MKLNWAERWAVNNPLRVVQQALEIKWMHRAARDFPRGATVLEIGGGRGVASRLLMEEFKPDRVYLTDLDLEMLRRSLEYPGPGKRKEVRFAAADAVSLPYPSGIFDAVFGFGVIHHVIAWRDALKEMARVLRPGGFYFLEELYPSLYANFLTKKILLHPREDRFEAAPWKEALRRSGFVFRKILEHPLLGMLGVARYCVGQGGDGLEPFPSDYHGRKERCQNP